MLLTKAYHYGYIIFTAHCLQLLKKIGFIVKNYFVATQLYLLTVR